MTCRLQTCPLLSSRLDIPFALLVAATRRSNLPLKQIRPVSYFSPQEIATSDHKPVGAVLLVPTVWRNTVEEPARHGAATQGALNAVHALHMPFGGGGHNARGSGSGHGGAGGGGGGPGAGGGARVRLVFGQLRAEGLFVLRNRRRKSSANSTEMPSPQVRYGRCCEYPRGAESE